MDTKYVGGVYVIESALKSHTPAVKAAQTALVCRNPVAAAAAAADKTYCRLRASTYAATTSMVEPVSV